MVENHKPYKIIGQGIGYEIREFKDYNPRELFWHRDKETRDVVLLSGCVKLQFDNELPVQLIKGNKYRIDKMKFHRVISEKDFTIKVIFIDGE